MLQRPEECPRGGPRRTRRAEALANATVLTVMIAQGPRAGGHVPAVRYTGSALGEPRFEAAHSSLHDALNF